MFTLPCKRRKERKERKEAQVPVISAPFMFRREETGEVKSILEMVRVLMYSNLSLETSRLMWRFLPLVEHAVTGWTSAEIRLK